MKAEPALVLRAKPSLKLRSNCTAGDASEPKVAVAIMQYGCVFFVTENTADVVSLETSLVAVTV
jgi:hypothetical protein